MIVSKVTRVVNPHRRPAKRRSAARRRSNAGNPAHMLTLGFLNPKRSHTVKVARRKKRRNTRRAVRRSAAPRSTHRRRTRKRNSTRIVVMRPKSNHRRRRSRNPIFFGSQASMSKMAEYVAGGLIGVAVNKAVLPMLPASLTGSNLMATATAVGVALAEWWVAGMLSKDFGAAVGFGGLMNAGSQALNAFVPQVGSFVSLSGYRGGVGDFVPARFSVPQNPVLDAGTGLPTNGALMHSAYPPAYGA